MPTTRNRWHIESQKSKVAAPTKAQSSDNDIALSSTAPASVKTPENPTSHSSLDRVEEDDINPRSPKRPRLSPIEQSQEETSLLEACPETISHSPPVGASPINQPASKSPHNQTSIPQIVSEHGASLNPKPPISGPSQQTRLDNLSILSNLSSQLLSVLAKMSPSEALQLSRPPSFQAAREYHFIRSLFNPVRELYLQNGPFLSPTCLGLTDPEQVETLRKSNQAMYMSSIFTGEIGLRDMDQNFLQVFVPEQGRLLKALGSIYLELKTQAFITARRTGAPDLITVMAELFPQDMESMLLERRPGVTKSFAPSEQDFLNRLSSRRDILLADLRNNTLDQLPLRYRWEDLSREVSAYLGKNFGPAATNPANPVEATNSQTAPSVPSQPQSQLQGEFSIHAPPMPVGGNSVSVPAHTSTASAPLLDLDDFVAQAARAAEIAMQGQSSSFELSQLSHSPAPDPSSYARVDPQFQHYTPAASNGGHVKPSPFPPGHDEIPHISQTAPTHVLYERARQATTAKTSAMNRKPVTPTQRRPWTPEEEAAIMTGLDQVKGPHWSQILAMYGPGGTINESLKDRNQVQLKDKARNLKLFFLKAGIEVPYYLKYVTGDLKTRAPGQAEKHEARERERQQNDDHRAHFDGLQGIMALASATQTPVESESPEVSSYSADDMLEGEAETGMEGNAVDSSDAQLDLEVMIARAAAQASEPMPQN